MAEQANDILSEVQRSGTGKVKVAITDIDGILRGKYVHTDKFASAMSGGFGFCNVVFGWDAADMVYDNAKYTGWHTGYPDATVQLDPATFRKIPWDDDTPFVLGDFVNEDGSPLSVCPRQLLKKVLKRAEGLGYTAMCGVEYEFFNFLETPHSLEEKSYRDMTPLTPGMFGYSILRSTYDQPYFSTLMDELALFGVPLEGLHTETGPGVFEAAIQVDEALEAADRAVLFKTATKEIAYRFGIIPTFMARWNTELPGCSGHIHQSLWKDGANAFFQDNDPHKMSDTFRHYLAGMMHALPELLPLYAPTVNSYKRLVEGFWAPTSVAWSVDNRTAAFRVISGSSKSTRIETRVGGADINAYLAIAGFIAAGIHGIENKLELKDAPIMGNAYEQRDAKKLASNLYEAARLMENSRLARDLLGDEFVDHFTASRIWEWREYQKAVTDWELRRYFEII